MCVRGLYDLPSATRVIHRFGLVNLPSRAEGIGPSPPQTPQRPQRRQTLPDIDVGRCAEIVLRASGRTRVRLPTASRRQPAVTRTCVIPGCALGFLEAPTRYKT